MSTKMKTTNGTMTNGTTPDQGITDAIPVKTVTKATTTAVGAEPEEYLIVLASGALFWVDECPLPLWPDDKGVQHYIRGVSLADESGAKRLCFFERPMSEFEALSQAKKT
jgi:hypothetical protein